jgi:hypothetical protein
MISINSMNQSELKESQVKQHESPQVMVWLEPKRYVTLAYRFDRRPPTMQDIENMIATQRLNGATTIKVHFAGTIYRPDKARGEPDLPQHLRAFKKQYQNMRAILRKEALRRFQQFGLSCTIDLNPFVHKLRLWYIKEIVHKQHLTSHKQQPSKVKIPKALPPKPDFQAYLRAELRKILLNGCHCPRKEQ